MPSALKNPVPLVKTLREVFLCVYPSSKLYTDDTGRFPVRACLGNQYVMIGYHTDGNLILQPAFQVKANENTSLLLISSWHSWRLMGFLLISISEIMRPVQTSSNSSLSRGKQHSILFLQGCTGETKLSESYGTWKTTSSLFLPLLTPHFHRTFGISSYPMLD
jgi:hypothetical protein